MTAEPFLVAAPLTMQSWHSVLDAVYDAIPEKGLTFGMSSAGFHDNIRRLCGDDLAKSRPIMSAVPGRAEFVDTALAHPRKFVTLEYKPAAGPNRRDRRVMEKLRRKGLV